MAANKPFKHQALNLDRTQIRLFRLLPADRSGNLAGTIAIYDFEHCPEYRAVSYTWGLPYPTREISLEGQSFTVRENLWQFLDAAREYAKDWLWVDQVCIDQSTVDERNHQVSLMAKIYAKAFEVLIWLGTEAHGSGKAMEAINSGVDSIHQYESEVQSLFRRPYWDRLWILQEVLMGQNILVLCGNQSFTWKRLEALFVPQGIEDRLWTYPVHIYNVALSLIEEKASFKGANRRLSYMLESFAGLQCEDTRDKVYGLLSLVRTSGVIPVDYSKTSADVFFNAIQRIVRDESFMEINSHFNVGQHLRDRMVLVNISDTEIFDFINKELPEKRDQTALWLAATNGHEGKVKLLLDQSADVEAADEYGRTPLYQASNNGHVDVVRLLLDRGADVEVADSNGWKLLYRASYNGHIDVVRLLLEKGADVVVASHGRTPLLSASTSGHVEIVKLLLEKGADVTVASQEGWTPLHSASGRGHIEIVKLLLATEKVDADSKNKWGRTPLSYAAGNGRDGVVKLLLATEKVDIDTKDISSLTPLSYAAGNGHEGVVQLLLATGQVDIDSKATGEYNAGRTPLSYAAAHGHETVVKLLIEKGAEFNTWAREVQSMLQAAASKGNHSLLQLLIGKAKNVDIQGNIFEDALHLACVQGYMVVVKQLTSVGINPSKVDEHGWTPLLCASWFGHGQIVDYLLSNGGNKDLQSPVKTIPPSSWSAVEKSTCLQLDESLTFVRYSDNTTRELSAALILANHPIPLQANSYYYEIEVLNSGDTCEIGLGLCSGYTLLDSMPGWRSMSWGYHGDNGKKHFKGTGTPYGTTFKTGDVVGCNVHLKGNIFFTLNGASLGVAFESISGKLYPAVGMRSRGAHIRVNFGQEAFVYNGTKD